MRILVHLCKYKDTSKKIDPCSRDMIYKFTISPIEFIT